MPTKQILNILDEASLLGCEKVSFSGGEPTIRDDIVDILKHCRSKGMKANITSNGQLIDASMAHDIAQARPYRVKISLDSHIEEHHDKQVGMNGAWKRTMGAIQHLIQYSETLIHAVSIQTVINSSNKNELTDFLEFVHDLGVTTVHFIHIFHTQMDRTTNWLSAIKTSMN